MAQRRAEVVVSEGERNHLEHLIARANEAVSDQQMPDLQDGGHLILTVRHHVGEDWLSDLEVTGSESEGDRLVRETPCPGHLTRPRDSQTVSGEDRSRR